MLLVAALAVADRVWLFRQILRAHGGAAGADRGGHGRARQPEFFERGAAQLGANPSRCELVHRGKARMGWRSKRGRAFAKIVRGCGFFATGGQKKRHPHIEFVGPILGPENGLIFGPDLTVGN